MPARPEDDIQSVAGRLYDEHGAALYRYALMLLADPSGAEDAVHHVFASLLRGQYRIEAGKDVHYLRRAVRNECYSMLRRRRVRNEVDAAPLLEPRAVQGDKPEERLALEGALRELPPEQREVVHLHVFEGLTLQEIADASGVSINTVASRYRYALARLRDALK
jgi:RNA polymerase sigma-70 factor (ECF subfamily)